MVESKNKPTATRARLAHKLARYYRATPIHLAGIQGNNQPSASHLSILSFIQLLEELLNADLETKPTPGIQLTTKNHISREKENSLEPTKVENLSNLDQLSSFSQV